MAKTRIFSDNLADYSSTVITAASASLDLPVANVRHPHRTRPYRTGTATAAEWVKFDLGSAKAVDSLILLDHTLTAGDSAIALEGNATDSWGSPSFSQALTFNADVIAAVLAAAQTYRWWRITFTKSAAGETRDIGRIFLGVAYECELSPKLPQGWEIKRNDLSTTDRARGGQTYSDIRLQYDEIKLTFPGVASDAFVAALHAVAQTVGTHTPLFVQVAPDVDPYGSLYYAKLSKLGARKVALPGVVSGFRWTDVGLEMAVEL